MNWLTTPSLSLLTTALLAPNLLAQGIAEIEPNNTVATASPTARGYQADGAINAAGDVDYYAFNVRTNLDLQIWINPGIGASLVDSDLELIGPNGTTVLAFNDDTTAPASPLSHIKAGNLVAGRYFVRVRSSQVNDPNGTGTYTMDVVSAPPGTYLPIGGGSTSIPTPINEAAEDNDPRQPAGVATVTLVDSHNFGEILAATTGTSFTNPLADYDVYEVQVTRNGLLEIETLPIAAAPAMTDTVVFLATDALNPIVLNDDGGTGLLSRVTHYTAVGTYHVVVAGKGTGNYVLDIQLTPSQPTLVPTITVQSGGCGPVLTVRQTVGGLRTETCVLGSAFYLDANGLPPSTVVLKVIGTQTLAAPFVPGGWLGTQCQLEVQPIDQAPDTSLANGDFYWSLRTPMALWLIGLTIEQQLAVIDIGANPLNMTITNRVSSVCGISNQ